MNFSIIIPVYNVEKYIVKCLESCINQDISQNCYEVVVVNDGTLDNSMDIVNQYKIRFPHLIKIINQKNAGLSAARNAGLSIAKGEYVWFVDSDDYIEDNILSGLISFIRHHKDVDLIQIQYRMVYEDSTMKKNIISSLFTNEVAGNEALASGGLHIPAQFALFRREFLLQNNLKFYPAIYHEDLEFKPRATVLAKKIIDYPKICYNYLQRSSGSITATFKLKNGIDMLKVANSLKKFSCNMPLDVKIFFYDYIGIALNTVLYGLRSLSKEEQDIIKSYLITSVNRDLFKCMAKSSNLKYRFEAKIFLLNINLGLFIHKLLR